MGIDSDDDLPVRTRKRVTPRLVPYLMFIYLLGYLDRANVGVAKIQMQADLGFSDAVIGFGAGIFFLGYLLMNIPASLLAERWSTPALLMGAISANLPAIFKPAARQLERQAAGEWHRRLEVLDRALRRHHQR